MKLLSIFYLNYVIAVKALTTKIKCNRCFILGEEVEERKSKKRGEAKGRTERPLWHLLQVTNCHQMLTAFALAPIFIGREPKDILS